MLGSIWQSSNYAAENLCTTEKTLSYLRENGFLKPGLNWGNIYKIFIRLDSHPYTQ